MNLSDDLKEGPMYANDAYLDHAATDAFEAGFQREGTDDVVRVSEADQGHWVEGEDGDTWVPAAARTEQVIREVVLSDNNRGRFEKRFKRLASACARHGQELKLLRWTTVEVQHPLFATRTTRRNAAVISLPPVVGERGQVIGHFERAEDNTSWYIHAFDEANLEIVRTFETRADQCDHCGKARRRNQTFVVRTAEGDKLVARQCLLAYIGIDPLSALALAAAYSAVNGDGDPDESLGGGRGAGFIHVESLVRIAYRVARKLGGYSKDNAGLHCFLLENGKPDAHASAFEQRKQQDILDSYKGFDPECDLFALADYVEGAQGDFGENLRLAFSLEFVQEKRRRLIIAGVGLSVGRVLKRAEEAETKAALPAAKLLDAEEGKRIDIVGTVLRTHIHDGQFGPTCIVSIRCADGSNLVNFHTGANRPEAGKVFSIRATVKRHGNDKRSGEPVTTITRAVYSDAPSQPALI